MDEDSGTRATRRAMPSTSTSNDANHGDETRASSADDDSLSFLRMMNDFSPTDVREPLVFMSWNANGLLNRVRDKVRGRSGVPREAMALKEAIMKRKPDVIALQEVWLKCAGGPSEGTTGGKWCVVVARRRRLYRSSDVFVAKARSSAGWTDREPNGGAGDTPNRARTENTGKINRSSRT